MTNANVNTAINGNNAKELQVISPERELHVINPNVPKRKAKRQAKLRKQRRIAMAIIGVGLVFFLCHLATVGVFFLLAGGVGLVSREVLLDD